MHKNTKIIWFSALLFCFAFQGSAAKIKDDHCNGSGSYRVGTGIYDITGPAAEQSMMGYGQITQKTKGIYQRLWARAFVIESLCNHKKIVFVNADLGQLFQGITQEVIRTLKKHYGDQYNEANVLLTAIHQHSGPGGYSTYAFYNLNTLGFYRYYFQIIVDGIVKAIDQAHNNLEVASIGLSFDNLIGISKNRAALAYQQNPEDERQRYRYSVDTLMTQLRFDTLNGKPLGILNWFPIHGTSLNNKNKMISGDNKGYAEYLFEKDFQSKYKSGSFVAAFAQSNVGDVSPNLNGSEGGDKGLGRIRVEEAGKPQYEMAKQLFNGAQLLVHGPIDYRHMYVKMDNIVLKQYHSPGTSTTCTAGIGLPMLGGTSDGRGIDLTDESIKAVLNVFSKKTKCQGAKNIILETGNKLPYPWTPNIVPLQIIRIGNVAIAAVPFELTTMAGRRLREALANELKSIGIDYVVLSCLANAYAGYITTEEEYKAQEYEGASTHFGPLTLLAVQQEFSQLAKSLINKHSLPSGPIPNNLVNVIQINTQLPVILDATPIGKTFGDLHEDLNYSPQGIITKPGYQRGETVTVKFWGAIPRNDFRIGNTFLEIQVLKNGNWKTIRNDHDWETEYVWERNKVSYSIITIKWHIPPDVPEGHYRIKHNGNYKRLWPGDIIPYTGFSREFVVK